VRGQMQNPTPPGGTVWGVTPVLAATTDLAGQSFLNLANFTPDTNDLTPPQPITIPSSAYAIDTSKGVTTGEADQINALLTAYTKVISLNVAIRTAENRLITAGQNKNAAGVAVQQQALARLLVQQPGLLNQVLDAQPAADLVLEAHLPPVT